MRDQLIIFSIGLILGFIAGFFVCGMRIIVESIPVSVCDSRKDMYNVYMLKNCLKQIGGDKNE